MADINTARAAFNKVAGIDTTTQPQEAPESTPAVATQVAHPGRATWRTATAGAISIIVALPVILGVVIDGMGDQLPGKVKGILVATSAFTVALTATLTRIMAIPAVNEALSRIGLSAAPRT